MEVKRLLDEEYGEPYKISNAFIQRLSNWPVIKCDDGPSLKRFSLFLTKSNNAMKAITQMTVLNHPPNMQSVVQKFLRKSQGNSPRFAGSTKLRTVSFHVPLFYDPMYNLSIFYHLSILQSISQSFHNLLLFAISSNPSSLHLQNRFYLCTLFGSTHPIACI